MEDSVWNDFSSERATSRDFSSLMIQCVCRNYFATLCSRHGVCMKPVEDLHYCGKLAGAWCESNLRTERGSHTESVEQHQAEERLMS